MVRKSISQLNQACFIMSYSMHQKKYLVRNDHLSGFYCLDHVAAHIITLILGSWSLTRALLHKKVLLIKLLIIQHIIELCIKCYEIVIKVKYLYFFHVMNKDHGITITFRDKGSRS